MDAQLRKGGFIVARQAGMAKHRMTGRATGVAVVMLCVFPCAAMAQKTLADLTLFFGGSSKMNASGVVELITYFNQVARADDGYFFMESSLLDDPVNHLSF